MTRFSRSVVSRSARLSARLVLPTSLLQLARIAALFRPIQSRLKPAPRRVVASTAGFGIAAIILLGLFGSQGARAQNATSTALYSPGGSIAVGYLRLTTSDCSKHRSPPPKSDPNLNVDQALFNYCEDEFAKIEWVPTNRLLLLPPPPTLGSTSQGRRAESAPEATPQADPPFTLTLTSSVPTLPFLGNWLVGASFALNAATPATATAGYEVGLRRQSDCSLDEDFILPGGTMPDAEYITSLTDAQDYYHLLAGLTTTPDVFANGCGYQVWGLPATGGALLLGSTSDGAAINANLASNGLYASVTDLTANTFTSTQLSNSQNAGYFATASLRNNGIFDLVETGLTDPVTSAAATAVFLGNGDGTFKPPVYYDVSDNGLGEFTIDDVTGDGIPDIVELTTSGLAIANVTTLIGKGDGTFTIGPVSAVTGVPSDQPLTGVFKTGDVKDLLVGGTVLFGSGNGSFTVGPTNTSIASATNYLFPGAVGSLRNNGKLDVVVTQPGFVSIFYGNGDGTFTAGPSYAALPDYMQVTITDVDGDGNPDIVLGTSTGGIYTDGTTDVEIPMFQILMGLGDGTFVDSPVYDQGTYAVQGNANNTATGNCQRELHGKWRSRCAGVCPK